MAFENKRLNIIDKQRNQKLQKREKETLHKRVCQQ